MDAAQLESSWQELIDGIQHPPKLSYDRIHVWQASTVVAPTVLRALERALTSDERARADRFHFERDRISFIVCRGLLRQLLALYTGDAGARIRFQYGPQGKPMLENPCFPVLHFNVSHSGSRALLAFALGHEVGIDVEYMREDLDFVALAERFFSKAEHAALLALPPECRGILFYEYWTCKEACLKADGRGLHVPLDEFSIMKSVDGPAWREIVPKERCPMVPPWRMLTLEAGTGYVGAVAAKTTRWDVLRVRLRA